jgi:undecaprenyl diphosphate synthase
MPPSPDGKAASDKPPQKKRRASKAGTRANRSDPRPAVPAHIAIIMDGNGRWAQRRGLPRTEGHRVGAGRVREIVEKCLELGVGYLSIYAFSKENWNRPRAEVSGILRLSEIFFRKEFDALKSKGVFFAHLGERKGLPAFIRRIIERMEKNNAEERRLTLSIAFNYSGRSEITQACGRLMESAVRGEIAPSELTEAEFARRLYTGTGGAGGIPDPDLLIRTGGEMRVSNFLLWQIAYSEIWVTDTLWPDFTAGSLLEAIEEYGRRERRFGGV